MEPTIWVLGHDRVSHDWVSNAILVLSTDTELVLMTFYKFLYGAVCELAVDVGAYQGPVCSASLSFLNDIVGDL